MQRDYVHHDASGVNRQGPVGPGGGGQDPDGVILIPNWLIDELMGTIGPRQWRVLFYLVCCAGGGEGACVTLSDHDFLHQRTGCGIKSPSTLRKALAGLEARGIITCWRHGARPATYRVATYEEYHQ